MTTKSSKQRHIKETYRQDWDMLTVSMAPEILTKALKFSKTNNIVLSQLMTSAVKVFIIEAEEYIEKQLRMKSSFFNSTDTFRIGASFTTEDACKKNNLARGAKTPGEEMAKAQRKHAESKLKQDWNAKGKGKKL